jgi:hypothetical protein
MFVQCDSCGCNVGVITAVMYSSTVPLGVAQGTTDDNEEWGTEILVRDFSLLT